MSDTELFGPVFHAQVRNAPEISRIPRHKKGIPVDRDSGDLQVHRADPNARPSQLVISVSRMINAFSRAAWDEAIGDILGPGGQSLRKPDRS
jgi:hypothetical protein